MGLGFRMATPLVVKGGAGTILGSHGGRNEAGNWGLAGTWWNYAGTVSGQHVGIQAVAAADNARPVWAHAHTGAIRRADLVLGVAQRHPEHAVTKCRVSAVQT